MIKLAEQGKSIFIFMDSIRIALTAATRKHTNSWHKTHDMPQVSKNMTLHMALHMTEHNTEHITEHIAHKHHPHKFEKSQPRKFKHRGPRNSKTHKPTQLTPPTPIAIPNKHNATNTNHPPHDGNRRWRLSSRSCRSLVASTESAVPRSAGVDCRTPCTRTSNLPSLLESSATDADSSGCGWGWAEDAGLRWLG